ncbi:MAG TPA: hypothetical protein VFV73_39085 [Streptosporangiaceae bacterium]|nr:hypothetical protein [Streptosporangiaceae bacterium]
MTHTGPVRDHRTRDNRTDNDSYISRIGRFGPVRSTHSVARIVSSRRSVDDWIVSSRGLAPDRVRGGPSVIAHEAPGDIVTVGTQPEGWGVSINWNTDQDMAIVAFINSSSVDGLRVTGVRDGDTFQLDTASGSATYAVDTENEGIPGLISVVAVGANVAAGVFGQAELSPLINSAAQYARQQFPERQVNAKSRDAFGVDRNGGFAQQEGGVIVCAPAAHQFYYSGSDSDEGRRRWVQGNGRRTPENFPRHIVAGTAFFLRAEAPVQSLYGTGSMILGAWDGQDAFRDNFGFYEVSFILRRGQAGSWPNGPVPLREQARATKGVRKFSGNVRAAKRNSPAMR